MGKAANTYPNAIPDELAQGVEAVHLARNEHLYISNQRQQVDTQAAQGTHLEEVKRKAHIAERCWVVGAKRDMHAMIHYGRQWVHRHRTGEPLMAV